MDGAGIAIAPGLPEGTIEGRTKHQLPVWTGPFFFHIRELRSFEFWSETILRTKMFWD